MLSDLSIVFDALKDSRNASRDSGTDLVKRSKAIHSCFKAFASALNACTFGNFGLSLPQDSVEILENRRKAMIIGIDFAVSVSSFDYVGALNAFLAFWELLEKQTKIYDSSISGTMG